MRVEHRSRDEGQRDRYRQHDHPVVAEPAVGGGDRGDDEAEFTVTCQRLRGECGGAYPNPETRQQPEEQAGLDRDRQQQQQRHRKHSRFRDPGHADAEEKADQEQVFEAEQRLEQLAGLGVPGEQGAKNQCAQVTFHVDQFEQPGATEGQYQAEQNLQFPVANPVEQGRKHGPQRDDRNDHHRRQR